MIKDYDNGIYKIISDIEHNCVTNCLITVIFRIKEFTFKLFLITTKNSYE